MAWWTWRVAGVLIGALGLWTIGSWAVVAGIEEARYGVVATANGYELRRYEPVIVAQIAMPTMSSGDRGRAFRGIAGYIFGGNEGAQSIAMTAPVVMSPASSGEKIAMTAPVIMAGGTMAFVMPSKFKVIGDLPKPKDDAVTLRALPARTVAALRFSGNAGDMVVAGKMAELQAMLARDGVKALSAPYLASYDPPFSMPLLKRNDILVEVEGT